MIQDEKSPPWPTPPQPRTERGHQGMLQGVGNVLMCDRGDCHHCGPSQNEVTSLTDRGTKILPRPCQRHPPCRPVFRPKRKEKYGSFSFIKIEELLLVLGGHPILGLSTWGSQDTAKEKVPIEKFILLVLCRRRIFTQALQKHRVLHIQLRVLLR